MARWLVMAALLIGPTAFATPDLSVTASPDAVVLGRDHQVTFTVHNGGAHLHAVARIGTLEPASAKGTFAWTAPDSGAPRTAVFVFYRDAHRPAVAVVRVPLIGRTDLAVNTASKARVTVTVAGKDFGPRTADAHGRVKVPIEVPPGAQIAHVRAAAAGRIETRTVPLHVPPDEPLLLAVERTPLPRGEARTVILASTRHVPSDRLELSARGATVRRLSAPDGTALFRLRPETKATEVRLHGSLHGPLTVSARAHFSVVAPPAGGASAPPAKTTRPSPSPTPVVQLAPPAFVPEAEVSAALGGMAISGQDPGIALHVEGGLRPGFWDHRLAVDVSLGWMRSGLEAPGGGYARLQAMPLALSLRAEVLRFGRFAVSLRAGFGGVAYAVQRIESRFATRADSGLGWEAFGDLGGRWRIGRWEPFVSVGGALAPVHSPLISAKLSGVRVRLGLRWEL